MDKENEIGRLRKIINLKHSNSITGNEAMYNLQEEGIVLANKILEKHNTVMFADDVGLGKTYEGLGIIFSKFEELKKCNILIIAPNDSIARKWINEYNFFKANCYMGNKEIPKINDCIDDPLMLLNLSNENKKISIIRANRFSSLVRPISNLKDENLENILDDVKDKIQEIKNNKNNIDTNTKNYYIQSIIVELNKKLNIFDLIIIDESQNLRSGQETLKNKFINDFFGFKRFRDKSNRSIKEKFKKIVLLTATPDHNSFDDIFRQFRYFENGIENNPNIINWIRKFDDNNIEKQINIIQRSRMFDGKNKYAFRNFEAISTESNLLEKLTFSVLHKRIVNANEEIRDMKCIDGFESFVKNNTNSYNQHNNDNDEKDFEYDNNEKVEKYFIDDLIDTLKEQGIVVSHPKIRALVNHIEQNSKLDKIDKKLIFVRRINSTKELEKILIQKYDNDIRELVIEKYVDLSDKNCRDIIDELYKKNNGYDELVIDDSEITEEDDSNVIEEYYDSIWLNQLKRKTEGKQTKLFLFNQRFFKNKGLDSFFEEDFLNLLGYKIQNASVENNVLKIFINNECDVIEITEEKINEKLNNYKVAIQNGKILNTDFKRLIISIIFDCLSKHDTFVKEFKEKIYEQIYLEKLNISEKNSMIESINFNSINKSILNEKNSLWEIDYIHQKLDIDAKEINIKKLMRREIIKEIIKRNLRKGEGIIYLYCLFLEQNSNKDLKKLFEEDIKKENKFAKRILSRILDFIENFDVQNKILGIDIENENIFKKNINECKKYVRSSPIEKSSSLQKKSLSVIGKCFNTSFYPDIIIATDIIKEGIDLQINCSNIYHYGVAWLPGDMEQRIGRIDRYFSKTYREYDKCEDEKEKSKHKVNVYFIYSENTMDERQVSRVISRMVKSIYFKNNNCNFNDENIEVDKIEDNIKKLNELCKEDNL